MGMSLHSSLIMLCWVDWNTHVVSHTTHRESQTMGNGEDTCLCEWLRLGVLMLLALMKCPSCVMTGTWCRMNIALRGALFTAMRCVTWSRPLLS